MSTNQNALKLGHVFLEPVPCQKCKKARSAHHLCAIKLGQSMGIEDAGTWCNECLMEAVQECVDDTAVR